VAENIIVYGQEKWLTAMVINFQGRICHKVGGCSFTK